jgi:hypothetical protein
LFFCVQANALESLSYSGRLVQTNGSPVTGPVNLRAELVYTNNLSSVLCSDDISSVALSKGVFHVKLDFTCSGGKTLSQVLSQAPVNESVAIQITDVTNSKAYSFQALHALPYASVASQLTQMGAGDGEFLKWDDTAKQWKPGTVSGASGGTVTSVSVSAPLSIATPSSTPSITLPQANGTTSGYLSSADWNAFNSKEGSYTAGTTAQYYRGDKSWQTLDTNNVPENINLYFTNARALGVPLTGFTAGAGTINATDTILSAFGKTQGQIITLTNNSTHFLLKDSADTLSGNTTLTGVITADPILGDIVVRSTPMGMTSAVNKSYVDAAAGLKVNKAGDTMSGVLTLDDDLKIKGGTNYVTIKGHATSANYNLVLPSTAGTTGYVLQTDGSGNLSWINPATVSAGAGTVDSSSITNGSIVDADINASAAIAQSKIANLTTDLAAKVSTTLSNGNILVGNGSNVATAVAVSGDATLSNTGAITLANTAVTAGTYKSVTVDGKGRVTGGTNPTTLAGYGITDTLVTGVSVTAPITNTGTAAVPLIGMPAATTSANGYLTSTDWNTFNNKQAAITTTSNVAMRELRLNELTVNGPEYIGFKSPDALTATVIYTLPSTDGSNGQALTTNSTGGLSWTTVATSSSSLTGDIGGSIGANTIGAGKVTLAHLSATGTKDNTTYLRGDNTFTSFAADVRTSVLTGLSTSTNAVITAADSVLSSLGKLQKQISDFAVSTVGGDLSGNLPNPTVVKIQGKAISSSAPSPGQVLRFNAGGTSWDPTFLLMPDLKSSVSGNLFPGTACTANQTLQYSIGIDAFVCVNIDLLDGSKITTGTIAAARLPLSASYWSAATGGINYAGGNVGIGTSAPNATLDVVNTIGGAPSLKLSNTATNMPYIMFQSGGFIQDIGAGMIRSRAVGASSALVFDTNSLERVRIDSAGNVGIGNISPQKALEVSGASSPTVRISTGGSTTSFSDIVDYAATQMLINKTGAAGGVMMDLNPIPSDGTSTSDVRLFRNVNTSGQKRFMILKGDGTATVDSQITSGGNTWFNNGGGYVGIGTNSPSTNLHVQGNNAGPIMTRVQNLNSTGYSSVRLFNDANDIYRALEIDYTGSAYPTSALTGGPTGEAATVATTGAYPLVFGTNNSARMMISATGKVGIGTNSPAGPFHMAGGAPFILYEENDTPQKFFTGVDGTNFWIRESTTANVDLLTIKNTGNIGIGTINPNSKLEVAGQIAGKSYKTRLFEAGGKTSGTCTLSTANTLAMPDQFCDLSVTFTLTDAASAQIQYSISMMSGSAGAGRHLVTGLEIDGTVVSSAITGVTDLNSTPYFGLSQTHFANLGVGAHTIKIKYRTPTGGTSYPGLNDWENRILQVMILGYQ